MFQTSQSQGRKIDTKKKELTQTLTFTIAPDLKGASSINIFKMVCDGKITQLHDYLHSLTVEARKDKRENMVQEDIASLLNSQDSQGKTPLFYAIYYNYRNLVLYLLIKGADPHMMDLNHTNIYHVACFLARIDCICLVVNFERHVLRVETKKKIKSLLTEFNFKKSDIHQGVLICSDKHIEEVQRRFDEFKYNIYRLYEDFTNMIIEKFKADLLTIDAKNRNPIHYAGFSKHTKCYMTARYLLDCNIHAEKYEEFLTMFEELQNLEVNKEKKIDPRQFSTILNILENFLLPKEFRIINERFYREINEIQREIVNTQDSEGYTPLHLASFYGDFTLVKYLIKLGADPQKKETKSKKEVLYFASNEETRKSLIDLKDAARKGDINSLNLLINCGNSINSKKTIFGIAPIHNAIEFSHKNQDYECLKTIIKCDADVNLYDSNGWTALHHACETGDKTIVKILLENEADLFKFSNKGYFPIHIAALNNHYEIIQILLNYINENQLPPILELKNNGKATSLLLAAKKGNIETVQTLLNYGADMYAYDELKWTALHHATFNHRKEVINLLCKQDADFEKLRYMRNCQGKLANELINKEEIKFSFNTLWKAAADGNLDIVRRLIILDENINEQTVKKKFTPLILATKNNHFLVVKFLLEKKADESLRDDNRLIAKDYAFSFDPSKININTNHSLELKDKKKQKEIVIETIKKEAAKNRKILALLNHDDGEEEL